MEKSETLTQQINNAVSGQGTRPPVVVVRNNKVKPRGSEHVLKWVVISAVVVLKKLDIRWKALP